MRICYVLLSPTFGMHQYTADLANRMVQYGRDVHLVTTARYPDHRYLPTITVHTPVDTRSSGFSRDTLQLAAMRRTAQVIQGIRPDVVHMTGPHLWSIPLLWTMCRAGIPAVHTLHDLDPHEGMLYGLLLHAWNREVLRLADHVLVHGVCYRDRLLDWGMPAERLTCTPLLFLFLGNIWLGEVEHLAQAVRYEPCVLFFGRLERYKGVDHLLTAWAMMDEHNGRDERLILAGPGNLDRLWYGPLPPRVEVHNHLIDDAQALELFRRCGLLALPYIGATQSANIAAAYYFHKPVVVTRSGALPEYVEEGRTGCVVEPGHPPTLARCLEGMLGDPARLARMGAAGRAWYDAQRAEEGRALMQMYDRLARQRPREEPIAQSSDHPIHG
jgi:glycosyltransferase involved in cell wall biosynthesis